MNKNIVKIIAVAAGAVSILACNKVSTYTPAPYAVIDSRSIEVEESEAGKLIQIPVYVYNRDGECSVTYTFEEGSAKNGKHFTPANTSASGYSSATFAAKASATIDLNSGSESIRRLSQ